MIQNKKFDQALEKIYTHCRFMAYFYLNCDFRESKSVPTMGVTTVQDRVVLMYSDTFINELKQEELIGVLTHEFLHILNGHIDRGKGYNRQLANIAMDMVINEEIAAHGSTFFPSREGNKVVMALPKTVCYLPDVLKPKQGELTWEEVYEYLKKDLKNKIKQMVKQQGQGQGQGQKGQGSSGQGQGQKCQGHGMDVSDLFDDAEKEEIEKALGGKKIDDHSSWDEMDGEGSKTVQSASIDRILERAKIQSQKDAGNEGSAYFLNKLEKINKRKLFPQQLKSRIDFFAQGNLDLSWKKLHRKKLHNNIIDKSLCMSHNQYITTVVDVSGSMSQQDLEDSFGVIEPLTTKYSIKYCTIDTAITDIANYRPGDWKNIKISGGGGTVFDELFTTYLKGHSETCIILTDGGIYDLDTLKPYPNTIWVVFRNSNFKAPFGKTVYVD